MSSPNFNKNTKLQSIGFTWTQKSQDHFIQDKHKTLNSSPPSSPKQYYIIYYIILLI